MAGTIGINPGRRILHFDLWHIRMRITGSMSPDSRSVLNMEARTSNSINRHQTNRPMTSAEFSKGNVWRRSVKRCRRLVAPDCPSDGMRRCPVADRVTLTVCRSLPVCPNQRTSSGRVGLFGAELRICRSHSITSSAVASSVGGTARPSVFAVFILMTSSNDVGLRLDGQIPMAWYP